MKRIIEYRKLFDVARDADLNELKNVYRKLVKQWHPDKFQEGDPGKAQAESKSKLIIEAYHFLVSISPETHLQNKDKPLSAGRRASRSPASCGPSAEGLTVRRRPESAK